MPLSLCRGGLLADLDPCPEGVACSPAALCVLGHRDALLRCRGYLHHPEVMSGCIRPMKVWSFAHRARKYLEVVTANPFSEFALWLLSAR